MRVGQGFDVHKFGDAGKLILGGVEIDYPKGLEGHSDADVLTHAVIDALLGAAALGDIGMHFPDTDPAYKNASSIEMLVTICSAIYALGYSIHGIDVTLIAQTPRIGPYRARMVENLSTAASIEPERINVKATSTEGLGFTGRSEGIAAMAVAVLDEGQSFEEGQR